MHPFLAATALNGTCTIFDRTGCKTLLFTKYALPIRFCFFNTCRLNATFFRHRECYRIDLHKSRRERD
jgi:hypothetical protein